MSDAKTPYQQPEENAVTTPLPRTDADCFGYYDGKAMTALIGQTIREVWWSDDRITFITDEGVASYEVEGDCCSHSYFHDLIGFDKLLSGPVLSVNTVDLDSTDARCHLCKRDESGYDGDVVQVYGFQIVTLHPTWGEVTTALSFRNDSNGYYGGWMERCQTDKVYAAQKRLTGDKVTG